eukprot:Em0021g893a
MSLHLLTCKFDALQSVPSRAVCGFSMIYFSKKLECLVGNTALANHGEVCCKPELFCGNKPELFCGNKPELFCGNKPELICGNKPELFCGNKPELICGNKPELFCGNKPELFCGNKPELFCDDLDFEDCFREHKSTKLVDPIYKVYGITYKYIKLAVYHLLVLVFGIPIAIIWALINAIIAFTCTWLWSPVLKIVVLLIYGISPLVTETVRAFMSPLVDMSARILRQIRLHVTTGDKLTEAIGALGRSKAV